ncbi:MAG: oligosaccharide flippase family protein [Erythrobacter sp.]
MNLGARGAVLQGAVWMGAARIVVNLTAFASTIILARLLSPADFGLVAIATAAATVLAMVSELSLTQALIKFEDPCDDDFHSAWTLNLMRAVALATALLALAPALAVAYADPRLVPVMAVVAVSNAIRALENPRIVMFRRALNFRPDFQFDVAEKMAAFVFAVALAVVLRSYWALILGTLAGTLARIVLTYAMMPYRPRLRLNRWRSLLSFSIWLTLAETVKAINLRAVPLVVGAFLPTGAVGQFTLGERVASMPVRESVSALQATLFPAFSRMAHDLPRMRAAYVRAQAMTCLFAAPMGFGLAALAEPVVQVLIGAKWLPSVPIIRAVAITSSIMAIQNVLPLAMATGNTQQLLNRNLRALMVQMPLIVAGLAIGRASAVGGLTGLAIAMVLSTSANTLLNLLLVRKLVASPLREQLGLAARPMVASALMFAVLTCMVEHLGARSGQSATIADLALMVGVGALVFGAFLFILHALFADAQSAERELANIVRTRLRKSGATE